MMVPQKSEITLREYLRNLQYTSMVNAQSYAGEQEETEQDTKNTKNNASAQELYTSMREKYEDYIAITYDQLQLASTTETEQLRKWIDDIAPTDVKKIKEAHKWYQLDYQKRAKSALELYHEQFTSPLKYALSAGAISKESYAEWMQWIHDKKRNYKEKEASIQSVFPDYIERRMQMASHRTALLRDKRLARLQSIADPDLKKDIAIIKDNTAFLTALDIKERQVLITNITANLPLVEEEKALFENFEKTLDTAVREKLISPESKKRWIARFKDPKVSFRATEYFVTEQFPSYLEAWRTAKKQRATLLKRKEYSQITSKDLKDIAILKDENKFAALHYDKKVALLAECNAVILSMEKHTQALRKETHDVLKAAATAGYMSNNAVGPWLEHVLDGSRKLSELKTFIKDWAKVRFRYDTIQMNMTEGKAPQGFQRLSTEKFLLLSYAQRLSYVEEAEKRFNIEKTTNSNTPFDNKKGKVRHALDTEQWDEARLFLQEAWPLAKNAEDIAELQSMERYLKAFGTDKNAQSETSPEKEIYSSYREIDSCLALMPSSMQELYRKALRYGSDCFWAVSTCVYNRTWCEERGYLDEAKEETLREQSRIETRERLSISGPGHGTGLENQDTQGFGMPSIRDDNLAPQNVFLDTSSCESFVEKANANKNNKEFWYWTNAIMKGVSSGQNAFIAYSLNHRLKHATRTLEKYNRTYGSPVTQGSIHSN